MYSTLAQPEKNVCFFVCGGVVPLGGRRGCGLSHVGADGDVTNLDLNGRFLTKYEIAKIK